MIEQNLTTRKGERTRLALIDTAYTLFVEQGFHGTSMRQIAEGAGLALGACNAKITTKLIFLEKIECDLGFCIARGQHMRPLSFLNSHLRTCVRPVEIYLASNGTQRTGTRQKSRWPGFIDGWSTSGVTGFLSWHMGIVNLTLGTVNQATN